MRHLAKKLNKLPKKREKPNIVVFSAKRELLSGEKRQVTSKPPKGKGGDTTYLSTDGVDIQEL